MGSGFFSLRLQRLTLVVFQSFKIQLLSNACIIITIGCADIKCGS